MWVVCGGRRSSTFFRPSSTNVAIYEGRMLGWDASCGSHSMAVGLNLRTYKLDKYYSIYRH
jgi:hypothetical protein